MRKIGQALWPTATGLTMRKIAASLGIARMTASEYLKRAGRANLGWPLPEGLTEANLERRLFKPVGGDSRKRLAQPNWPAARRALKRKGVTPALVWEGHRGAHPEDGCGNAPRPVSTMSPANAPSWIAPAILDHWGPDRLTASQCQDLMEIVENRYQAGSTVITSQFPVDAGRAIIDEPAFADAVLDHLIHNVQRLPLDGPSLHKTHYATIEEDRE